VLEEPNPHLYSFVYREDFFYPRNCNKIQMSFRAHSSIKLTESSSVVKKLTNPPCKSHEFDACGMLNSIYWYNSRINNFDCYKTVTNTGGLTEEEIGRGIYRYNCELDKWFPVPEMRRKVARACIIADSNLVYLLGGEKVVDGYVQAYDHRAPKWLRIRDTSKSYRNAAACTLNGNIYVSDLKVVETYDSLAGKWHRVSVVPIKPRSKRLATCAEKRMVLFENLLFLFGCHDPNRCQTNIIDPYEQTSENWSVNRFLKKIIRREDRTQAREWGTDYSDHGCSTTDSVRAEQ